MLHNQIRAACPCSCCMSMSILHVYVACPCPCQCCMSMSISMDKYIYRNSRMPDCPAFGQSGTGLEKKLTPEKDRCWTKLTESGIFFIPEPDQNSGCRNDEAGVSFLNADAQLWWRVTRNPSPCFKCNGSTTVTSSCYLKCNENVTKNCSRN
jgi:hypothetical protein